MTAVLANPVGKCMAAKPVPGRRGLLLCAANENGHPVDSQGRLLHTEASGMFTWTEA